MKLGNYSINKPVFMAPMAGITDKAFREIIQLTGGKYAFTEMISDNALLHQNSKTYRMLNLDGEQEPRIVQLFGSDPEQMAKAAIIVEENNANVIDINMGCPTPKIVKNGEGAALLKNLNLAEKIAHAVVNAVKIPVTVKIRLGWDDSGIVALELASRLEDAGICMISVHARTREQYYSGKADWKWIGKVKKNVHIPVIGNGDIQSPQDALRMIRETGCDGVMIARGALGNPWLIGRTQHFLETGEFLPEPGEESKLNVLLNHFEKLLEYKGEKIGLNEIRKHAAWYIKGRRNAAEYRKEIMTTQNPNSMRAIFQKIFLE
ncbi:MAG: putative tRNA-dihydrouridine synthase [Candidatus Dichloromethanomonas elyunquensis]|nr:MAG: putative tRNA-dihydrouridine synthase [Candidatus Dichloromethanomonas elyunquensis]